MREELNREMTKKDVIPALAGIVFAATVIAWFNGFFDESVSASATSSPAVVAHQAEPDHWYSMNDGMQYGYEMGISDDARRAGQVAPSLIMAYYAGHKDNRYQAHMIDGLSVSSVECESPCKYLKVMTFYDNDLINVEHVVAAYGSIGYMIMQDAMHGKLRQYGRGIDGKRYTVWADEENGIKYTEIK